jgi:tubulin alpha
MQLRTGRIGLAAYLHRINRCDSARCSCDLGNQTVSHILLECPLLQDERNWMKNALSNRGVALRCSELLTRPEARPIMAAFMIRTGLLDRFQAVDPMVLGVDGKQ